MDDDSKPNLIKKVKKQLTKMKSSPSKVMTEKDNADGKGSMEKTDNTDGKDSMEKTGDLTLS